MKNFEEIIKLYTKDFNLIAEKAKKDRLPDKKIDNLQECYFEALICSFFKCSNMPLNVKVRIADSVKKRIQRGKA